MQTGSNGQTCVTDGCGLPSGRGPYCKKCRQRVARHGAPVIMIAPKGLGETLVKSTLATGDRTRCWPWPYGRIKGGYGMTGGRLVTHVVLEMEGHPRPTAPDDQALHSCDNPPCFNPSHLRWGSSQENVDDRESRDRYMARRGAKPKLTSEQRADLRSRFIPGKPGRLNMEYSQSGNKRELAAEFGISTVTLMRIVRDPDKSFRDVI